MSRSHRQAGATLLVTMIMLVIFTLFGVTMISGSGVNLKVVGNMQAKKRVEADAQQAIEQVLSDADNFAPPLNQFPQTVVINDSSIDLAVPTCLRQVNVSGYAIGSATQPGLAPLDMVWEVEASALDASSGAAAVLRQGVRMRRPLGSLCP